MDSETRPFRYRLTPLLRRDEWERNLLGGELTRARIVVEQAQRLHETALGQVTAAQQKMRELHAQDCTIELAARRLLHVYLEQAHAAETQRRAEMSRAQRLLEQVQAQFESKRLAVRTLEKHRERQASAHDSEQSRSQLRRADEAWLLRSGRR